MADPGEEPRRGRPYPADRQVSSPARPASGPSAPPGSTTAYRRARCRYGSGHTARISAAGTGSEPTIHRSTLPLAPAAWSPIQSANAVSAVTAASP
ncbi:hypothetical protein [Streptomyces sp. NPDC050856]|uniref:hypothetical protein n=1 Tax=Streptomyces sp. NPDC050856 TaxID=3154939 RepID=UPI003409AD41